MTPRLSGLLLCCAAFALTAIAGAQFHISPTLKRTVMLIRKDVQVELKLTDKQISAIKDQFGETIQDAGDGKGARIMISGDTDVDQIEEGAARALEPAQRKRLNQLWIQEDGFATLAAKDIREEMKLDKDLLEKIDKEITNMNDEISDFAMAHSNPSDPAEMKDAQQKLVGIRNKTNDRIKALLSNDQLKAWEELKGPKFDPKKSGG